MEIERNICKIIL